MMFIAFFISIFVAASTLSSGASKLHSNVPGENEANFQKFKSNHKKSYSSTAEDSKRFSIFTDNLKLADARNALDPGVHGVTQFFDLTTKEFETKYLSLRPDMKTSTGLSNAIPIAAPASSGLGVASGGRDWTGVLTTPIKNQGSCGSCWAFAAAAQIESDAMRLLAQTFILSPAQINDCSTANSGCNGGWPATAMAYVQSAGGLMLDSDYPYYAGSTGVTGACSTGTLFLPKVSVSSYSFVGTNVEDTMASYLLSTGPIQVDMAASAWNSYTGGIMTAASCGTSINHAIQAVGVYIDPTGATPSYWKIRNQWGSGWGEAGFIRVAYGTNTCQIANNGGLISTVELSPSAPSKSPSYTNPPTRAPSAVPTKSPAWSAAPTMAPFYCDSYAASNTNSAQQNTASCMFQGIGGTTLSVSACSGTIGVCSGDTYIRLYSNGVMVSSNDDSCGLCSGLTYTVPAGSNPILTLVEGCYGSNTCSGRFQVTNAVSVTAVPSRAPTIRPSTPSARPSVKPSAPTRAPTPTANLIITYGLVPELGNLLLTCGASASIDSISFASYGTPINNGAGSYSINSNCHATTSASVIQSACVGRSTCNIFADNSVFGDPCVGTGKRLAAKITCAATGTRSPSVVPTASPTLFPSAVPTAVPSVIPTATPTAAPFACAAFSSSGTSSVKQNVASCSFSVCGSTSVIINSCGINAAAGCTGTPYASLVSASTGSTLVSWMGGEMVYLPAVQAQGCQAVTLLQGCYDTSSCSGQYRVSGAWPVGTRLGGTLDSAPKSQPLIAEGPTGKADASTSSNTAV